MSKLLSNLLTPEIEIKELRRYKHCAPTARLCLGDLNDRQRFLRQNLFGQENREAGDPRNRPPRLDLSHLLRKGGQVRPGVYAPNPVAASIFAKRRLPQYVFAMLLHLLALKQALPQKAAGDRSQYHPRKRMDQEARLFQSGADPFAYANGTDPDPAEVVRDELTSYNNRKACNEPGRKPDRNLSHAEN